MDPNQCLSGINASLRTNLIESYAQIVRNFREHRWEPSELNGGKLCEVVHSILRGHVEGKMPTKASKPRNMVDACKALESADPTVFPRSVRIQTPRLLLALYEIRNNRGVGHVGGDVDPNHMDARLVLESSKWIMAELVRVFHSVSIDEATRAVEGLVERTLPAVWITSGSTKRVLVRGSMKEQTLMLLYESSGPVSEKELCAWVEHSNPSTYRRDVLRRAHAERLLEYDQSTGMVELSPVGAALVEDKLLAAKV